MSRGHRQQTTTTRTSCSRQRVTTQRHSRESKHRHADADLQRPILMIEMEMSMHRYAAAHRSICTSMGFACDRCPDRHRHQDSLHLIRPNTVHTSRLTLLSMQIPSSGSKGSVPARQTLVAISPAPELSSARPLRCDRRCPTKLVQQGTCIARHHRPPKLYRSAQDTCLSIQPLRRRTFTHNALSRIGEFRGRTAQGQESRRRRRAHTKHIELNAIVRRPNMRALSLPLRSSVSTTLSRCDDANSAATTALLPRHSTDPQCYAPM